MYAGCPLPHYPITLQTGFTLPRGEAESSPVSACPGFPLLFPIPGIVRSCIEGIRYGKERQDLRGESAGIVCLGRRLGRSVLPCTSFFSIIPVPIIPSGTVLRTHRARTIRKRKIGDQLRFFAYTRLMLRIGTSLRAARRGKRHWHRTLIRMQRFRGGAVGNS